MAHDHESRISSLEKWRSEMMVSQARAEEQRKSQSVLMGRIEKKVDKIDSHLSRLGWLVISGFVLALIGFVVKGGLVIG